MPTARWPAWCTASRFRARCSTRCSRASSGTPRAAATRRWKSARLRRARGGHGGRDDGAGDGNARTPHALARACELGRGHAADQHRPRRRRRRAQRPALPAARLDARSRHRPARPGCARRISTPAIGAVVQRLLDAADALYHRAETGIAALPRDCRPAIAAARLVYAEIGRQIERNGLDSVSQRAVVSRQRKLALDGARHERGAGVRPLRTAPACRRHLPAVQYLVDAASDGLAAGCRRAPLASCSERPG